MDHDYNICIDSTEWILSFMITGFIWVDILIVIAALLLLDLIIQKL